MKKITNTALMKEVDRLARESGACDECFEILDYFLPEDRNEFDIKDHRFDFVGHLLFGGVEGIYLTFYLRGIVDETGEPKTIRCGVYKTLKDDLDAMKKMGVLCGTLTYFSNRYINNNIDQFCA